MNEAMLKVLYEDNHLIAVNKPPCILVQGDNTGDKPLDSIIKEYIKKKDKKPGNVFLGVTHRLDRPASGIVLFAKTSKALSRINKLFRDNEMQKTYLAIVKQKPSKNNDTLVNFLARNRKLNKSFVVNEHHPKGKLAKMHYKLAGKSENYYLLQINLFTGRHHQIRCQLSQINAPIKGDLKYGFDRSNPNGGIDLHAWRLSFIHPVKKEKINITAPPPELKQWDMFDLSMPEIS